MDCNNSRKQRVSTGMKMINWFRFATGSLLLTLLAFGLAHASAAQDLPPGFERMELKVGGVAREALIYVPESAKATNTPVVFVFHGHGGGSRQVARSFAMDKQWQEAISVYMQGLNTPGRLTDPEGRKPGWQHAAGDHGDRDLKFFDAVLAKLKRDYKVDEKRVYSTGHSNGGAFTYLLWAERGDVFAAVAPSAAAFRDVARLKPKPAMHLAGKADALVKFEWQKVTMDAVRRLNGCATTGKPWDEQCTVYESKAGTPLVAFIHPGGHQFTKDAPALIAKFFKEHSN
jgi:polyhydroxybutyrate depolymerase